MLVVNTGEREARRELEEREAASKAESEALKAKLAETAAADLIASRTARLAEREADMATARLRAAREDEAVARKAAGNRSAFDESSVRVVVGSRAYSAASSTAAPTPAPASVATARRVFSLAPRTAPLPVAEPVREVSPAASSAASTPRATLEVRRPVGGLDTGAPAKPSWRDVEARKASSGGASAPPTRFDSAPTFDRSASSGGPPRVGSGTWSANRGADGPRREFPASLFCTHEFSLT